MLVSGSRARRGAPRDEQKPFTSFTTSESTMNISPQSDTPNPTSPLRDEIEAWERLAARFLESNEIPPADQKRAFAWIRFGIGLTTVAAVTAAPLLDQKQRPIGSVTCAQIDRLREVFEEFILPSEHNVFNVDSAQRQDDALKFIEGCR